MKYIARLSFIVITCLVLLLALGLVTNAAANANPTWHVDARCVFHGQCLPYDYYAAKDPTIVYYGGKYLVYYTGANQSGGWQMCFTSASTIAGLATAPRTYMSKIGESYFCAPELFYCEPKGQWYLVYQDGTYGVAYATSSNPGDPNSWSGPHSFGISGNTGWDYFVIFDDTYAYMYNTPSDGSGNLYMRKTTIANFPSGWSSSSVAISNVFEGSEVYKSLADGKYYLLVENDTDGRFYELFTSSSAGGPWTLVSQKWAYHGNLSYNADKWTTNVSHGELIRAGYNQKLEINDINQADFLIQGTTNMSVTYQQIIWDLGVIHNYTGTPNPTPTPTPTIAPTATPIPTPTPGPQSAFSPIEAESYSSQSGIQTESCGEGGQDIGYIENGDYVVYNNIDFGNGAAGFEARVASATSGGNIEIRLDSITGALVGTCSVAGTGGWQTWTTSTCSISGASGTHNLYLKFTGGSGYLFNINWFQFTSGSVTPTPTPVRTPTPVVTPTPVLTPTPTVPVTPTPQQGTPPPSGAIKVQFYNGSKADPSNQLYMNFQLVNTGSSAVALSNVKIRYWYTEDGTQAQTFWCDYSTVGSSNVTGTFVKMGTAKTGADTYLELGFTSGAGSLNAGASIQVQCRCAKSDWSNYTQSNDYSFNSSATAYVDWTKVTGYVSDALQWGTEP